MATVIALLFAVAINLFGGIFLLSSVDTLHRNRLFLALFFINSFLLFTGHFLSFQEFWYIFRYYDFVFLSSLLAFYPLYYLYLKSAFGFDILPFRWKTHFVPAVIFGIAMGITSIFSDTESYTQYMQSNVFGYEAVTTKAQLLLWIYKSSRALHVFQILFYNILSFVYFFRVYKKMNDTFSYIDPINKSYFYIVNVSFLFLMAIPGVYVTIVGRNSLTDNNWTLPAITFTFTLLYLILGIIGFRQNPITQTLVSQPTISDNVQSPDINNRHKTELIHYFTDKKPWLNPTLNIWEVSQAIGVNRTYVSNIINGELKCNFNTFVNQYRVDFAKQTMQAHPNKNLEQVAFDSGFGSLSSFIRAFKSIEGISPGNFRDELKA